LALVPSSSLEISGAIDLAAQTRNQLDTAGPTADMMITIEQLVQEKSELTAKLERIQDMLGVDKHAIETAIIGLTAAHSLLTLHALSNKVSVDSTGTVANYISTSKDADMSGCLITNRPLPMFDEGIYFEVKVVRVNQDNPDGLTVGVTLTVPWDPLEDVVAVPNTLDDIPLSWAVGYNGQCWSSSRKEWRDTSWSSKDLRAGQRVGVLVTCPPVSQLYIFVDDILVCRGPSRLPSCLDNEYFGLVDLLGNCDSVSIVASARPPTAAADLIPPLDPNQLNFRLPTRQSVSPTSALDISAELVAESHPRVAIPRLSLRQTLQPKGPVRPPSASSDDFP
jgi:hypothetical protein